MKKINLVLMSAVATLTACVSSTGPVPMGRDTYMIGLDGKGFLSSSEIIARAYKEANEFCRKQNKELMPINSRQRGMSFGVDPSAELQFMCLRSDDPDLQRPIMKQSDSVPQQTAPQQTTQSTPSAAPQPYMIPKRPTVTTNCTTVAGQVNCTSR